MRSMTAKIAVVPAMPKPMPRTMASETHCRRSAMRVAQRTSVTTWASTAHLSLAAVIPTRVLDVTRQPYYGHA